MKIIILLISLITFSFADQYTFLVDKYDKDIELEAKIVLNIAKASILNDIKLHIPKITSTEKEIYSKFFTLVNTCDEANFIFVKTKFEIDKLCENKAHGKLLFTNNYEKLIKNDNYLGAFFWNKSRPNIIFIKERLQEKNINLPAEYSKFIEEIENIK